MDSINGHRVIVDIDCEGNVIFADGGRKIGHFSNPSVQAFLQRLPYDALSGRLSAKIYVRIVMPHVCPVCGHDDMYVVNIMNDVQIGFCRHCQTDLMRNMNDLSVKLVHGERRPYTRIVNILRNAEEVA